MYVPFNQLPASARVWIYQANRTFTDSEIAALQPILQQFAGEWTSHGRSLSASAEVLHHQFLVIGLDETISDASGCSIDASVRFIQAVEEQLNIQLLEKSKLAFLVNGTIDLFDRRELRDAVSAGTIQSGTLYFDNTIQTVGQLRTAWPISAANTWLARYFQPVASREH